MFDLEREDGLQHWSVVELTNENGGYTTRFACGAQSGGDALDAQEVTCPACLRSPAMASIQARA